MFRRLAPLVAALGLVCLFFMTSTHSLAAACATPVFVNEFHYDNSGADSNELIEVAGPAGSDLAGWSLALYTDNGTSYATIALSGLIDDEGSGYGALSFAAPGLQNGPADGFALVDNSGAVRQFLSYEGVITASGGPAVGLISTDVGVVEGASTPLNTSLQLTGVSLCASDFTWTGPTTITPGALNSGQIFTSAPAVVSTSPGANALNVPIDATIIITFSEVVNGVSTFTINCTASGGQTVNPTGSGANVLSLPHVNFRGGERCTVTIPATSVVDLDVPANPLLADYTWSFDTGYPPASNATLFVMDEEGVDRTIVAAQDDAWRTLVQGSTGCNQFQTGLLSQTTNTLCGANTGDCINPNTFPAGLTINYTLRNMDGPALGSPDAWASGQAAGCTDPNSTLQDGAPRPTGITGCYYSDGEGFRGGDTSANGVLFTFSQPVTAFGAWFGDLETKPLGTAYYSGGAGGGTGTGGALAYLRLFFDDGTLQETSISPTHAPLGPWPALASPPPVATLSSGGNVGYCGGVDDPTDADGCGNESTRWVGFVANPGRKVTHMLVVVGDDDHSGSGPSDGPNVTCAGGDANTCNGGTEYLSFIGPTVCIPPDLALTKIESLDPAVAGAILTYTLTYSNLIPGIPAGPITITESLPPGLTYLATVAASPLATQLDNNPRWRIETLPADSTGFLTFIVQVDQALAGLMTNTATINTPGDEVTTNDTASASTLILTPGLALSKRTNGQAAPTPPGPAIEVDAAVTWSYQFTNTGTVTLTNLSLADDRIPALACNEGALPAVLSPGASFVCTVNGLAELGQYVNQAIVTATPTLNPTLILSASAVSHYVGIGTGDLIVVKQVINDNGGAATAAGFPLFVNGQPVTSGATNPLPMGVYTVTETTLAGYVGVFSDDCSADGVVVINPGDEKLCVLTNNDVPPSLAVLTVEKVVINDNGGAAGVGDFPLFVDNLPVSSGVDNLLAPGVYQVSETNLPGYAASFGGDCATDGSITLAAGEEKSCIITNDDVAATLTVHKVVINDDGGVAGAGDFPLFVDGQPVTNGLTTTLSLGDHFVAETNLPGYAATFSGDCLADGSVELGLGDRKSCTVTNNDLPPQQATLTVQKVVVNDSGGVAVASDFLLLVNGGAVNAGVANTLAPGTYTVSEINLPGYAASFSGGCDSSGLVTVGSGENKVCTITNDDIAPLLTVHKVVINDHGGAATVDDFALFVNQTPIVSGATQAFPAGAYTIHETNLPGYTATFSGDCATDGAITLNLGETQSCTITNDDLPPGQGVLTVHKVVINDSGGAAVTEDFPLFVNGQLVASGAETLLSPGVYTVSESGLPGYAATFSGDCGPDGLVTVAAGEHKSCLLTNDDRAPTLIVQKIVVNTDGGDAVATDFPLFVDGQRVTSGAINALITGAHTVHESNLLNYASTFGGDCALDGAVTLALGEAKTCTITNDDLPPSQGVLTVRKVVINDDGGAAMVSDFPLFVNRQTVSSGVDQLLAPGSYTVSESGLPGYAATLSGDCAADGMVTLQANQHAVCIITNDDIAPRLTVHKIVINDDGGSAVVTDFPLFVENQAVNSGVTNTLAVGNYQLSEANLPGYTATFSGDCAADGTIALGLGESKQCTITNNDFFASLGDVVWYDHNLDGVQDSNESGVAGVTVNLYNAHGGLIATTTTGEDGRYMFAQLLPGNYAVEVIRPKGFAFSPALRGGDLGLDSDVDTLNGRTGSMSLAPSEDNPTIDAGLYQLAALGDFVWNDLNADGQQDTNERGIQGIIVTLYDLNGSVVATTTTGANGYYGFSDLAPGAYTLHFALPEEYRFTNQDQSNDSVDSDVDPLSERTELINLAPDETNLTLDAGVLGYPLLVLHKTASQSALQLQANGANLLTYTLVYTNVGLIDATGVVITEQTPPQASFNAEFSSPGWQCTPVVAGADCQFVIGSLPSGAQGSAIFAVNLAEGVPQAMEITNQAQLTDDGLNRAVGADSPVPEATAITRILPPTALAEEEEPVQLPHRIYLPWVER